jgi:hypothetical protein
MQLDEDVLLRRFAAIFRKRDRIAVIVPIPDEAPE